MDKIKGRITEAFWKIMTEKWEKERLEILEKLEAYQNHRKWYEETQRDNLRNFLLENETPILTN